MRIKASYFLACLALVVCGVWAVWRLPSEWSKQPDHWKPAVSGRSDEAGGDESWYDEYRGGWVRGKKSRYAIANPTKRVAGRSGVAMATIYLDPANANINKGTRDPSTPSTSPNTSADATAGTETVNNETFDAAPSLSSVNSVTFHIYGRCSAIDPGLGAVNISLITGAGAQIGSAVNLSSTTSNAWSSVTCSASDLTTTLGHAPAQADITALKLRIQSDAFDSGGANTTYIYSAAYLELDYVAAGGGGPTTAQKGAGFFAFPP
jgi:hypothetical protein